MAVTRKTTAKTDPVQEFVNEVVNMVKSGTLDNYLPEFDEAVTERIAQYNDEQAKKNAAKSASAPATKTVPQPTRKTAAPSFVPDVNGTYVITGGKSLDGKKCKFLRFRKDDDKKAVVEMLEDAPGAPKGKKMIVPVAALKKPVAAGRRVVKKGK